MHLQTSYFRFFSTALLVLAAILLQPAASATETVPKEVKLIINGKRLVASNVRFSRFDEISLNAQESIIKRKESKGVIVVVTNQRIIAYGVSSGWRDLKTQAGERVEKLDVEDFAAFVVSNKRFLNFNGETGVWGKSDKRTER
jgi:hypothetical protein